MARRSDNARHGGRPRRPRSLARPRTGAGAASDARCGASAAKPLLRRPRAVEVLERVASGDGRAVAVAVAGTSIVDLAGQSVTTDRRSDLGVVGEGAVAHLHGPRSDQVQIEVVAVDDSGVRVSPEGQVEQSPGDTADGGGDVGAVLS